ncbi:hypothetical protein GF326_13400 [Candidatus Bathyarchaeota archaeon]|nr:hypothetical protein [Candidatus Bathyarchaeota archaeon]
MSDELVPLAEAENEVKVVTQRLALLHLAFSKSIVDSLGWETGKQLILDSVKLYGEYVAERTKQGYQGLPKYGFWERREGKPHLCELGKIMLEMDEPELGAMYCLIDPAKTMAADNSEKMIHTRCMILGHDECQFDTVPTSEEDKNSFKKGEDWSHVDPLIDAFLDEY